MLKVRVFHRHLVNISEKKILEAVEIRRHSPEISNEEELREAWCVKIDRNSPFWHYYNRRDTLTTTNDCLLTANRIVIPKSLHRRVHSSLHKANPG
ncbi:hypothetical protein Y032_0014g2515 [Ancylostoma ceylanicum]|uniref:Uncharacterized protein n=1 Tax=Ancylostoma ceylanicum TaxID=53326 RepID=A0A016V9W5_9BILA|nr:hypothetical protein Y032_0014g2515 [Ancylostoma ceylanicum]